MMVMFGANGNSTAYYLIGRYWGKVGMLMSPETYQRPKEWLPFALDNGKFIHFTNKTEWSEEVWVNMLKKVKELGRKPRFVAVPDVVMDAKTTLELWSTYSPAVKQMGFVPAFVAQDGHTYKDVPADAEVVFIGGSTKWKYQSLPMWTKNFKRVHVGRVNGVWRLDIMERLGVESCDGSGWFRDTDEGRRIRQLTHWLSKKEQQLEMI